MTIAAMTLGMAWSDCARSCKQTVVIDFEGIEEGTIIDTLTPGSGIGATSLTGSISISATSNGGAFGESTTGNAAMIFDSTCTGGCSGRDRDLKAPEYGNTLIITEDGDTSDPDDAARGGSIHIDFSGFGPGVFDVCSFVGVDLEDQSGGLKLASFVGAISDTEVASIPGTDFSGVVDGEVITVDVNGANGISSITITTDDSGAYDEFELCVPVTEGCTPGYWKQKHHFDSWCVSPDTTYASVFGSVPDPRIKDDLTLLEAVKFKGNKRKYEAFLRHSAAGYLNACNDDVDYRFPGTDTVVGLYNEAVADGDLESFKDYFESANEEGCPLN